jgi:1-acyl-sn-glycerol-3-phosphate acyltransferase
MKASPALHGSGAKFRARRLATVLMACFRGVRVACHIIFGMLLAGIFPLLDKPAQQRIVKGWSRTLLDVLHVGLETQDCHYPATARSRLFVANHISWLDAVVMNAVVPAGFVAKSEVREWPLLGWMCQRIGTLFIKRDIRRDTARINRQVAESLMRGECIALFPEGTSSDGALPGHFHSSLLQGSLDVGAAIHPVAIRYHDGNGKANGDAAYVDDMSFIQSLWKILHSPSLHVTLVHLPALASAGKNRRTLAAEAHGAICMALHRLSCARAADGAATAARHNPLSPIQPIYSLLLNPVLALKNHRRK